MGISHEVLIAFFFKKEHSAEAPPGWGGLRKRLPPGCFRKEISSGQSRDKGGTLVIQRSFLWLGETFFALALSQRKWRILGDVSGGTAVLGRMCAKRDGWEGFCESVVKVTKRICKMTEQNPGIGGSCLQFCKTVIFIMHCLLVLIEKTYGKVLYFSIDNRGKRC